MKKLKQHSIDKEDSVISISGLFKSFDELEVLRGINFQLFKGENVAVLGKSGTGKSVLIKIIIGLLKPDRGEVVVLGQHVAQLESKELNALRIRIGFSFQNSALYDSMNVYQNLAFPLTMNRKNLNKKEVDDAVEEVLEAVGLTDKLKQMPSDLSGGQRKRIGIARTLILKPEIMLYDEPTSGLDPITSAEIIELINEVQQKYNTSSVIITHDLTCAKNSANRIAMLLEGEFLKVGTFDEVFDTNDEQVKAFFDYNFIQ
jgi:phospholipid/cholesterol/gamma-HCH transport system ATP-binding protein